MVKRARSFSRSAKGPETLSDDGTSQIGPIVVALEIDDVELANHLAALLAGVAGLRFAARGEPSDVIITDAPSKAEQADLDPILTTRETEVLTLLSEGAYVEFGGMDRNVEPPGDLLVGARHARQRRSGRWRRACRGSDRRLGVLDL